jgi:Na+:H+ antiporter
MYPIDVFLHVHPLLTYTKANFLRQQKDVKTMVLSRLFRRGTSSSTLVGQVEFLVLLLIVTLIVALLARRLRVPSTLLLVIVGLVFGLFLFLPDRHIDPNPIFYVFLPALLFKGAWNAEIDRLEADWLANVLLVVPGMVLSLLVVAIALSWGIGFEWLLACWWMQLVHPPTRLRSLTCFSSSVCPIA